jgi:Rod binding domain-containing protein
MLYVNPLTNSKTLGMSQPNSPERRKQALQEFEHLLAFQLLREMRKTVPKNDLMGNSTESDYYDEMMDDFLAGQMANSGQLGVAKLMEEQLLRGMGKLPEGSPGNDKAEDSLEALRAAGGSRIHDVVPINLPAAMAGAEPQAEN